MVTCPEWDSGQLGFSSEAGEAKGHLATRSPERQTWPEDLQVTVTRVGAQARRFHQQFKNFAFWCLCFIIFWGCQTKTGNQNQNKKGRRKPHRAAPMCALTVAHSSPKPSTPRPWGSSSGVGHGAGWLWLGFESDSADYNVLWRLQVTTAFVPSWHLHL